MRAITTNTAARAFMRIVNLIPDAWVIQKDESGYEYHELETLCVHIENPLEKLDDLIPLSPLGKQAMDYYRDQLVCGEHIKKENPEDEAEYTYYGRLREYKTAVFSECYCSEIETDQILEILEKLNEFKNTRRAVAVTWQPWIDLESNDPPCMDFLKFTIKDNKLNLTVVFRSHDLIKGWVNNVYALIHLMEDMTRYLNVGVGYLEVISCDPHVYINDTKQIQLLRSI